MADQIRHRSRSTFFLLNPKYPDSWGGNRVGDVTSPDTNAALHAVDEATCWHRTNRFPETGLAVCTPLVRGKAVVERCLGDVVCVVRQNLVRGAHDHIQDRLLCVAGG